MAARSGSGAAAPPPQCCGCSRLFVSGTRRSLVGARSMPGCGSFGDLHRVARNADSSGQTGASARPAGDPGKKANAPARDLHEWSTKPGGFRGAGRHQFRPRIRGREFFESQYPGDVDLNRAASQFRFGRSRGPLATGSPEGRVARFLGRGLRAGRSIGALNHVGAGEGPGQADLPRWSLDQAHFASYPTNAGPGAGAQELA